MPEFAQYSETAPIDLNLKDKKTLQALDFHARQPYSQLADDVGLSKQGAEYKVKRLQEKGVIKGFYPVINVHKLDYTYGRLLVNLRGVTKETFKEIINHLVQHENVFWLFQMQGQYDLLIVIWAKTVTEFQNFIEALEGKYGEYVKHKNETIATDVIHYQHRYLLEREDTDVIHLQETAETISIDNTDKAILKELCNDARQSLVDIGQAIDESAKVVSYRINKMEDNGLIQGYRPIIDHNKIGYTYLKILIDLNKASATTLNKLKERIRNNPIVLYVIEGIGLPADLDIEVMVQSNQQLFHFIDELRFDYPQIVEGYTTVVFMDTLKVRYLPF